MDHDQKNYIQFSELDCSHVERLANYFVDGELTEVLKPRFEKHVHGCEQCRELVQDLRDLLSLAKSLQEERIPRDVSLRLREALKARVGHDLSVGTNVLRFTKGNVPSGAKE